MAGKVCGLSGFVPVHESGLERPVVRARDVVFGRGGERDLTLDLFRPAKPEERPLPVVVFIHGGGWGGGTKESYHDLAARAASHGYLCASVFYRLSGEAPFPAALEDCKCAVRWVRANAARNGSDGEHIAVWGHSAGGHLAAMVALTPGKFEGEGGWHDASSAVQCAACFCAPSDLTVRSPHVLAGAIEQFVGPAPVHGRRPDDQRVRRLQASPLSHVSRQAPPFLIVHGDRDDVVPIEHAERLAAALREAGAQAELVRVKDAGHRLDLMNEEEAGPGGETLLGMTLGFLEKHLRRLT